MNINRLWFTSSFFQKLAIGSIALAKFYLMLGLISVYYCNMKAMKLNPKRMADGGNYIGNKLSVTHLIRTCLYIAC